MGNGTSATSGLGSNGCARDPDLRWLMIRIAGEAAEIGRSHGYALEKIGKFEAAAWIAAWQGDVAIRKTIDDDMLAACEGRSEDNRPSMGQDISKGRRTEIDFINGFVADKGAEIGIDAPANRGLVKAVTAVERGELAPSPERLRGI